MATSEIAIMHEIVEFAAHKFVIRLDGQQIMALVATIDLACRHPSFRGPTRTMAEMVASSLTRIARQAAPDLDLLESVCHIGWIPQQPKAPVHSMPKV